MKQATVIVSGAPQGDNIRDVEIPSGATAGDVLRALNLGGYLLSKEGNSQAYSEDEEIYAQVEEGGKLRAAPIAEVGMDWVSTVLEAFGVTQPLAQPDAKTHIPERAVKRSRALATPLKSRCVRIERDERPLWQVRGWRQVGDSLLGAYRTRRGSFSGEIRLCKGGRPNFFIVNPPKALLAGPKGACFRPRGDNRFWIHFYQPSNEIDSGLVAVEKLLVAALYQTVAV